MKLFIILTILISLSGCLLNTPPDRESEIFWNGVSRVDAKVNDMPINLDQHGKFRITWETDNPMTFFMTNMDYGYATGLDSIINDEGAGTIVLGSRLGETSAKYLDCEIDPSFVEIRCVNNSTEHDTGYISITHLYSELPATIILYTKTDFDWSDSGTFSTSGWNLLVD